MKTPVVGINKIKRKNGHVYQINYRLNGRRIRGVISSNKKDPELYKAKTQFETYSSDITAISDLEFPDGEGFWETLSSSADFLSETSVKFKDALISVIDNTGEIVENLLQLTWLYFGLFVIQAILLPMLMFWMMIKFINNMFDTELPVVLHQSSGKSRKTKTKSATAAKQ